MEMSPIREQIVAKLLELVERFLVGLRDLPEKDRLYVAEHGALRMARKIACVVLQAWLDSQHGGHCGHRWVDEDGTEWTFKQYLTRFVETVVGVATVRAAQYYSPQAQPHTRVPHYAALGLPSGRYSRGMEEVIALAGAGEVYREGLVLVNRLTGADLSVHKAETTTGAWGTAAKEQVKAELERPESPRERIAATRPIKGLRECIAVDGVSVQTTERWREAKLVAGYAFDAEGHKQGPCLYAGSLHYQEDFGQLAWHVMEQRRASRAETLVWLGDGAGWVWTLQQTLAPHAVAVVDFYHAHERLWKLGKALHPQAKAARRWSQKWTKNLYVGKVRALVRELARLRASRGDPPADGSQDDPRKLLAEAHGYFAHNAERMRYDTYRAKGYPIGSGVVESSCRHIVGLRMKRTATMAWTERNAEAMIQLRCLCASGEWDRFWGFDKLWKHIHALVA
jgi:hypothetical protein